MTTTVKFDLVFSVEGFVGSGVLSAIDEQSELSLNIDPQEFQIK